MKYKYNKWNWIEEIKLDRDIKDFYFIDERIPKAFQKANATCKVQEVCQPTNISFGVAEYCYDYEF